MKLYRLHSLPRRRSGFYCCDGDGNATWHRTLDTANRRADDLERQGHEQVDVIDAWNHLNA